MADQLVLIAQFFRFDGWLINIENSLSVSTPAPGAPRGPSAMPLSLTRPGLCYCSASCIPARAGSNLQPLSLFTGRWAFSSVMSRNLAWLSLASLVPSRRSCLPPLSLLGPHVRLPLHGALPFHWVLSSLDCGVHVLPASERKESRTSGCTLCLAAVGPRGFQDQDLFAPGVKCPVCPGTRALLTTGLPGPHGGSVSTPLSSWLPWGMCPTSSST